MMKFSVIPFFALGTYCASTTLTVYPRESTTVHYVTKTTGTATGAARTSGSITSASSASTSVIDQITDCHYHGKTQMCMFGDEEGIVVGAITVSGPASYTECHSHSQETWCVDSAGEEVQFVVGDTTTATTSSSSAGKSCHFHAGVEHCVGGDEEEESCEAVKRDYNIRLRIGLLFVVLVTSAIGSLGPLFIHMLLNVSLDGIIFTILRQFGTGVIISTAFVHLITHSMLMWNNSCMGELSYESTGTAITMAGVFLAFFIEYVANRIMNWRNDKLAAASSSSDKEEIEDEEKQGSEVQVQVQDSDHHRHGLLHPNDKISVLTMELGIIFHSLLIGITLVVAGDSFFITLFIVIVFHQLFEGISLGSRIAALESTTMLVKCLMGAAFAIVTPIGMAIGIGVLSKFNGNDKATLIAMGTLDSFSAGVLIWTGVVEMWAHDWLFGHLRNSPVITTTVAMVSLMSGMLLMSVLGKWA